MQQACRGFQKCTPIMHCSHPYSTTHSMLCSTTLGDEEGLHVVPLDLRLLSNAGRYISLLASKSTQLHNVLRYIYQVQRQMYNDFKVSQDLPSRLIANIEESLHDCSWIQAAYHLAVTGNCYPGVKEWLIDQLGERVRDIFRSTLYLRFVNSWPPFRDTSDGIRPQRQGTKMCDAWLMRICCQH